MESLWQDLRYGARRLRANPAFTLAAAFSLALGIGAATAIFSIVDAVLLRPLPYPAAGRLVALNELNERHNKIQFGEPNLDDLRARQHSLTAIVKYGGGVTTVLGGREPVRRQAVWVSREFFQVMGAQPAIGRGFTPEEARLNGAPAVVVSHAFWQEQLGGKSDLSGLQLRMDDSSFAVVGVMPPGFSFPPKTDLWTPSEVIAPLPSRTAHNWRALGRLKDGVALAGAQREISAIGKQLRQEHGKGVDLIDITTTPLRETLVGDVRRTLTLVLAAVGFLLLVACSNVANLLLARVTARQKEFAVRAALGATRWRMLRQLLAENLLLALFAGAAGVLLAIWGLDALVGLSKDYVPRTNEIAMNWRVLAFAFGLSALVALALGCVPAFRFGAGVLRAGLTEAGRGLSAHTVSKRLRAGLVVAQIALTLVLLIGAGLLAKSLRTLLQIDPGFQPESAVTMTFTVPSPNWAKPEAELEQQQQLAQGHQQMFERLRALPGVTAVGGVSTLPMTGGPDGQFLIDNDSNQKGNAEYRVVGGDYFTAMGIRLLRGRLFSDGDSANAPHAAVISQRLAQRYFPNADPLGRTLQFGNMDGYKNLLHIVGVVGDVREYGLDEPVTATIYAHYLQRPRRTADFTVVARAQGEASALMAPMRATMQSLQPDAPLEFRTLRQVFAASFDQRRFSLVLFGAFALTALVLALTGIYGVMAYAVTQRTQEIGIRMALGATGAKVMRLMLRYGLQLTLLGIGLGVAGAFAVTRLLATMLFEVRPTDPLTFIGGAAFLAAAALLACLIPARRATQVAPMIALRTE
ncbi:MAG: ABC transporter permease [Blastocatellales bacterium]